MQLQAAATIAAEVIKSVGDPNDRLGERLSWSMIEVRRKVIEDSGSRISKSKYDLYKAHSF